MMGLNIFPASAMSMRSVAFGMEKNEVTIRD
jgi:hypothetical protein